MNIIEIINNIEFAEVLATLTSGGFLGALAFIYNLMKKNAKARSENEVQTIETRGVIKAKDAQLESLIAQVAKLQNAIQASNEYSRAVAQVLINDPEVKTNLESVYNDSKAILAYNYERGKDLLSKLQTTTQGFIEKVELQKEQIQAVENDTIIANIFKKAGM